MQEEAFKRPLSDTSLKHLELFVNDSGFKMKELEQKKRDFEQEFQGSDFYKKKSFFEKQILTKEASILRKKELLNSK